MVDLIFNFAESSSNIRKIHDPTQFGINWTSHLNPDSKAVTVHPPALVSFRNIGQPMSRLNREVLKDIHEVS